MTNQTSGRTRPNTSLQSDQIPPVGQPGAAQGPARADAPSEAAATAESRRQLSAWGKRALVAWALIGAAILIYFTGIVLNVLAIPVGIIIWTVVLVFLLGWQVDALERRGVKRAWGTLAAYVGMFVFLAAIAFLMFSPLFSIGSQFENLVAGLPGYVEQLVTSINALTQRFADMANNAAVNDVLSNAQRALIEAASGLAGSSINNIIDIGQLTLNTFLCIGFALVVSFWIILEMPNLSREVFRLIPAKYAADATFFHQTMSHALGGYVKATVLQCGIIALGCVIAFSILGVPNSMAIGIIAGLLNVIPVVGPWLGGAVAALSALLQSPLVALLALVAAVIIQQLVYTFLSPKLMADSVDVHPALVIIALMMGSAIGMQMSGMVGSLVGMLLSIPLAAVGKAVFVYYFEKRTGRHLVSADGVFFKGTPSGSKPDPARDAVSPNPAWTGKMPPVEAPRSGRVYPQATSQSAPTTRLAGDAAPTQRLGDATVRQPSRQPGISARRDPQGGEAAAGGRTGARQPAHSGQKASNRKKGQPPQE